ncbi:MAG TPA: sulfatase [Firmicutes bacterium]|jgi:arylsulfatase A-like enzyme|nr:sulfatase [Bacillota bacterium]
MKAIVLMFDSLNRHMLPPYGCDWTHAPNFRRLAERTATFDTSYICSMPCMPARRDFHTGRPNFLHRSWGPLEPFDDSVPRILNRNGVSTHLISDHYHYWETGGATYHTQYHTWQAFRGQEGDPWMGWVGDISQDEYHGPPKAKHTLRWQDRVNRMFIKEEADHPISQTFNAGLDFIRRNANADRWLLHMETFDPHEPFFSAAKYKELYPEHYDTYRGLIQDWPDYAKVRETKEQVEHIRYEYAALLSMCDAKLGELLDTMDELQLWDDTMLIVWTDHGFMLSEHESWAKCWLPFYEEIAHTPFFVWDPRCKVKGERRQSLVQPSIDLGPTLLEFFGLEPTPDMLGKSLRDTIADDAPVRKYAIFGLFGAQVNITDGRYVYMRGAADKKNTPLFEYTLMPTHMREMFSVDELRDKITLAEPFGFTKGCKVMKIPSSGSPGLFEFGTNLYDLQEDPKQEHPLNDPQLEQEMIEQLVKAMQECEAPVEQYERLGLKTVAEAMGVTSS